MKSCMGLSTVCGIGFQRDLAHITIPAIGLVSASQNKGRHDMHKFILIAGFVLASATAQAGDVRSLSLDPLAPPASARAVDSSQTAQAPQAPQTTEAPKAEAPKDTPKYV